MVVDLSDKLDDELTIDRTYPSEGDRISSLDLDPPEFALDVNGEPTETHLYYRNEIVYKLIWSSGNTSIEIPFCKTISIFSRKSR